MTVAHEQNIEYGNLLEKVCCLAFMGTPHRGAKVADWTEMIARIGEYATLGTDGNAALLEALKSNSKELLAISRAWAPRYTNCKIFTFYELNNYPRAAFRVCCPDHSKNWPAI